MNFTSRDLSLLGMATRAGKTVNGNDTVEKTIREGKAKLVIVACDASDNTKKKFTDKCTYYNTELLFAGDKEILGKFVGKEFRAVVAVTDEGFAKALSEKIRRIING